MRTECSNCTYGYRREDLGSAFCSFRDKIIKKIYIDLTAKVLGTQCFKCENIDKWNSLDLEEQNLIMLYEKALENKNLELAQSTHSQLIRLNIDDITIPNNI